MSLTFQQACAAVKPGYYFKHLRCRWSEHFAQYGRDLNGELFWTAGMTTGGPLTKDRLETNNTGFRIYRHFGDRYPIEVDEQTPRGAVGPESAYSAPEAPLEAKVSFGCLYVRKGRDEVYNTYDLDRLHELARARAGEYPLLRVDPTGHQHLLVLSPTFHKFSADEDKLALGWALLKAYGKSVPRIELPQTNPMKDVAMEDVVGVNDVVAEESVTEILKKEQSAFISSLNSMVDNIAADEGIEQGHGARLAVVGVLELIDGRDGGSGYHLIEKKDNLRMAPFTTEAWEDANATVPFKIGLDLSGTLADLFDGINS